MVKCQVILLDQEKLDLELQKGALGQDLFDQLKQKLDLTEEADYFSISYKDAADLRWWLTMDKKIDKQLEAADQKQPYTLYWEVKFYPPVPEYINHDMTRYLMVLQIRKDIFDGRLPASFHSLAILGSYTAQGELGDYDRSIHMGTEYLKKYSFAPTQSEELLMRIADLHRSHRGMTPAEADLYFLQNAKRMAMYGMDLTKTKQAKDSKSKPVTVGVAASGLYLYEDKLRMESFKWPRIIKISYKAMNFLVKVRAGEYDKHDKILQYKMQDPKHAKRLWRIAVENHQFFRLNQPEDVESKHYGTFGSRKWRMSGRTQAQIKNAGTPSGTLRSMASQDNVLTSRHYSGSTLPMPTNSYDMEDPNRSYRTIGGHGTDRRVVGYDEYGNPIYEDDAYNTSMGYDPNGSMRHPNDPRFASEEDFIQEQGYDPATNTILDTAATIDRRDMERRENGRPPNEYESYEDIQRQLQAQQQQKPQYPYGVGELPMPYFSSQSAGVMPDGSIDYSLKLETNERCEKKLKERDTRLKNPRITVDSHADIDDQLLLDAILAVTGLDPRYEVDKIVIKREEETAA